MPTHFCCMHGMSYDAAAAMSQQKGREMQTIMGASYTPSGQLCRQELHKTPHIVSESDKSSQPELNMLGQLLSASLPGHNFELPHAAEHCKNLQGVSFLLTNRHKGGANIDSAGDDSRQQGAVGADGLKDDGCVEHDTVDACNSIACTSGSHDMACISSNGRSISCQESKRRPEGKKRGPLPVHCWRKGMKKDMTSSGR